MDAYFEQLDAQHHRPTEHTQGPWDPNFQHFGPPGALLTREVERCAADGEPLLLGRISFDILGPVPLTPLTVRAEVVRPGRRVRLVQAELLDGKRLLARAAAWAVRAAPDDVPAGGTEPGPPVPPPGPGVPAPTVPDHWSCGFLHSMEWHFVRGDYGRPGPATVWLRPRVPLLDTEPMSPEQQAVLSVDSANGVSAELDIREWGYVPPELTVHLTRQPRGPWLCLDAGSQVGAGRTGLTTSVLYDAEGPVARSAQTLLVHRR